MEEEESQLSMGAGVLACVAVSAYGQHAATLQYTSTRVTMTPPEIGVSPMPSRRVLDDVESGRRGGVVAAIMIVVLFRKWC